MFLFIFSVRLLKNRIFGLMGLLFCFAFMKRINYCLKLTTWYGGIFFLIYVGAILVLFFYILTLASKIK